MKLFLCLCYLMLVGSSSLAAVEVINLTPTLSGESLVIDLQQPMGSITSCVLHIAGSSEPKVVSCDSAGGADLFYHPYYFTARFTEDGVTESNLFDSNDLSGEFDFLFEFNSEDWSFLTDDGLADFVLFWERRDYGSGIGYCITTYPGYLTYDSVSLVISYNDLVPVSSTTWSSLKSIYR